MIDQPTRITRGGSRVAGDLENIFTLYKTGEMVEMVEMLLQLHAVPEAVRDLKAFLEQVAKVVHSQATLLQQEARPVQQIQVSFQAVEEVEEIADSKVVDLEIDLELHLEICLEPCLVCRLASTTGWPKVGRKTILSGVRLE